jgi:hypothetical protein
VRIINRLRKFFAPTVAPVAAPDPSTFALSEVGSLLASVFGDGMTADMAGGHFTCGEADSIALALILAGQPDAAQTWLEGHASADEPGDSHRIGDVDDWDAPDGRSMNEAEIGEYVADLAAA